MDPASLPESERTPLALHASQGAALDALESSTWAKELLGPEIVEATLAVRRYEQRTYGDASPEAVAEVCRLAFSC